MKNRKGILFRFLRKTQNSIIIIPKSCKIINIFLKKSVKKVIRKSILFGVFENGNAKSYRY